VAAAVLRVPNARRDALVVDADDPAPLRGDELEPGEPVVVAERPGGPGLATVDGGVEATRGSDREADGLADEVDVFERYGLGGAGGSRQRRTRKEQQDEHEERRPRDRRRSALATRGDRRASAPARRSGCTDSRHDSPLLAAPCAPRAGCRVQRPPAPARFAAAQDLPPPRGAIHRHDSTGQRRCRRAVPCAPSLTAGDTHSVPVVSDTGARAARSRQPVGRVAHRLAYGGRSRQTGRAATSAVQASPGTRLAAPPTP